MNTFFYNYEQAVGFNNHMLSKCRVNNLRH